MTNRSFIIKIILIFFITIYDALAISYSHLDSNYFAFLRIKGVVSEEYNAYIKDTKCGFGLINSVKKNLHQYSIEQRNKIQSVLQRPQKQRTLVTPSGKFKIHYDTIGFHAVNYSVIDLAKALDSVYSLEVNVMGFLPPPNDLGAGGDELYDVYIENISPLYGYTEFENSVGQFNYTSFIVIDNSFDEAQYYTKGINAAYVTVAHEFHHAIQIGNYGYRESDVWFHELTSTSMEEFVFDSVNDYYAYISNFFNRPDKIFTSFDGYSQAIWNIYLMLNFDYDYSLFVRQWELYRTNPALESIRKSIESRGKSFKSIFSKFYVYNYYTSYRSEPENFYPEGENYPLVRFNYPINLIQSFRTINGSQQPCSGNYYIVIDSVSKVPYPPDSIVVIIINANVDSALNWSNLSKLFNYLLKISRNKIDETFKEITPNIFFKLDVGDPQNWVDNYILNDTVMRKEIIAVNNFAFPMPANLNKHTFINIPLPKHWWGDIELKIYTVGMDLFYSTKKTPQILDDKLVIQWDGKNFNNAKATTGVYFYVILNGSEKITGKMVIVNE